MNTRLFISLSLFILITTVDLMAQQGVNKHDHILNVYINEIPDVLIKERNIPHKPTRIQLDRRRLKCYMPPEFIVNGKHWKYDEVLNLIPDDIIKVEVLKRPYPWKQYGLRKNITGIVLVTTKNKR